MLLFRPQEFQVYRITTPQGQFTDAIYTPLPTLLRADKQPISHAYSVANGFLNKNVNEVLFTDISADVQEHDKLVNAAGMEYFVAGIEKFDSVVRPHMEVFLTNQEWGTP